MHKPEQLRVEVLCAHHRLYNFSSGVPQVDATARRLQVRIHNLDSEDFTAVVVVAPSDYTRVLGIAAVTDVRLVGDADEAGNPLSGVCIFYSLLAVDQTAHGDVRIIHALLDALERLRSQRYSREDYIGEIAAPLEGLASLSEFLIRRGFRQLTSDESFWYRPRSAYAD